MDITYKNNKIRRICTNASIAQKKIGLQASDKLAFRLDQIYEAESVEWLVRYRIGRCHPLYGDRLGQYAMDLVHPYRLIFIKYDNMIDIVEIQEIVDYH